MVIASFELLTEPGYFENIIRITSRHAQFRDKHKGHKRIRDIRCFGTVLAIEFQTDGNSSYLSEMRNTLYPFFIEKGILLRPLGNLIYVIPPYIISDKELNKVYTTIEEYLGFD